MRKTIEIKLSPSEAAKPEVIRWRAAEAGGVAENLLTEVLILKRSIDARGSNPLIVLRIELFCGEKPTAEPALLARLSDVSCSTTVIIVGAGPAGYFAALELIEQGYKPVLFERGKDVRERRRDLRAIQQFAIVNPDSNYCFGEGGAGTYSDGKLYTRSHKRGDIQKSLLLLVEHGANPDILIDAHPHIGSNKLPKIVANIRETILHFGGEIHFNSRVTDIITSQGKVLGVVVNQEREWFSDAVILATGHSARDIYELLQRRQISMEAKPFALGVRIEHPQQLIDRIQYGQEERDEHLPASSYKLVCQVANRGVFSFCMCPGGLVVPAATSPGEIVVNGMSMSRRDSAYANSGTVVQVELEDLKHFEQSGAFQALHFQKQVEETLFRAGDGSQKAPAQRLTDFVAGRLSSSLPDSSYIPGLWSAPLHKLLPTFIYQRLQKGVQDFGRKMRGYYTGDAVVIGTESRSSAPVRIPRNKDTLMHAEVEGLFPAGEGAGYAGGIISAAMDGQNVATAVGKFLKSK
jgi:hypothetical protein